MDDALRVTRPAMQVAGYAARTTNRREAEPATAQIPGLWARLREPGGLGRIPHRAPTSRLCAVYTDYDDDQDGAYAVLVGAEVARLGELPEGVLGLALPAAACLSFALSGPMPEAVVAAWAQIWEAFPYQGLARAYTHDLELHPEDGDAEILVAVR